MRIYSAPDVAIPGAKPPGNPPPLSIGAGVSGQRLTDFIVKKVNVQKGADSLTRAMYDHFVSKIVNTTTFELPVGKTLHQAIIDAYGTISANGDPYELYYYNLYLYVFLYHLSVFTYIERAGKSLDPDIAKYILAQNIGDYIREELSSRYYSSDITIADEFFTSEAFKYALVEDAPLTDNIAPEAFGALTERNADNSFKYLRATGRRRRRAPITDAAAKQVKAEAIKTMRSCLSGMVNADVRKFLVNLAATNTPTGNLLMRSYGEYHHYALGNGTTTKAMFGLPGYGLPFFDYEIVDVDPLSSSPSAARKKDIPLLDANDDDETQVAVLYLGLDNSVGTGNPMDTNAPKVVLREYCDDQPVPTASDGNTLYAWDKADHVPGRSQGLPAEAIRFGDFRVQRPDSVRCDISTAPDYDPEEIVFIVFKHRIVHPRQRPSVLASAITLTTDWTFTDNRFRKTPTEIQAEVFAAEAADLTSLMTALVAEPNFVVMSDIQGRGVGRRRFGQAAGECALERDMGPGRQNDVSGDDPSYAALRYAHGKVLWVAPEDGDPARLIFYANGFVSPRTCTWDATNQPPSLATDIAPNLPGYEAQAPSYNCVLAAFRAFGMFDAMVERLLLEAATSNAVSSASYGNISTKLNAYRNNVATVRVLLPNNTVMAKRVSGVIVSNAYEFKRSEINSYN